MSIVLLNESSYFCVFIYVVYSITYSIDWFITILLIYLLVRPMRVPSMGVSKDNCEATKRKNTLAFHQVKDPTGSAMK